MDLGGLVHDVLVDGAASGAVSVADVTRVPVGLGGCRALGPSSFGPCAYDIIIFDGKGGPAPDIVCERDGNRIVVRHASLTESDSGRLLQYDGLRVLQDPSWDLNAMLQKIGARRGALYRDLARNSLLQSIFCCRKIYDSAEHQDVFAPCWQKCASLYLADAICALNGRRLSPSHMLKTLRSLPKSENNRHLSVVTETLGIERATVTLLARMAISTTGFVDHISVRMRGGRGGEERGGRDSYCELVSCKHDFLVSESMLADCYFYLGCVNKEHISRAGPLALGRHPELFHILKVALDVESDHYLLRRHAGAIQESCNLLLESMSGYD